MPSRVLPTGLDGPDGMAADGEYLFAANSDLDGYAGTSVSEFCARGRVIAQASLGHRAAAAGTARTVSSWTIS